ncbi:MspA family porin [Mycobacterium sp. SMC-2]|uniref:MspA family porin n=1 Tax=Mycobacterium sp. SMC-2 TaxID=2857058 RepID=UPI0021B482C8|nr:MspA family porin [Mycobacterium sp. SMC-2]UXA09375.1 MspA family porin [Mycobacterium sp. SMC-2]
MVVRRAAILALCVVMPTVMAPPTAADPDAETAAASVASDDGRVPSSDPVTFTTPEGWTLTVGAKDESQFPIAPLTTAVSSREYLARGTFVGSLDGVEDPHGVLEVGYEIGCGIDMSTSNGVTVGGGAGVSPGLGFTGLLAGTPAVVPLVTAPLNGLLTVGLKPGVVIVVPVVKKDFKGPNPRVIVTGFHVKIDGCVGQSFIRSYATLTQVTDESDVVLSYVGVTKSV